MVGNATLDPAPNQVHVDRTNGFRGAMIAAGLEIDESLIVQSDFSIKGAQRAVDRLFELDNPPTAIVAESDELAFGVINAARQHGLRVPEDLSVVGIDDHDVSDSFGLTTIAQPVRSLGEVAAWQVISHSQNPASVTMPTSLVVRNSSAPAHQ
jgi:LacI family transcriptional regulator, repressor for deo operon, udp, cdd, tsx, nupC, and nupG